MSLHPLFFCRVVQGVLRFATPGVRYRLFSSAVIVEWASYINQYHLSALIMSTTLVQLFVLHAAASEASLQVFSSGAAGAPCLYDLTVAHHLLLGHGELCWPSTPPLSLVRCDVHFSAVAVCECADAWSLWIALFHYCAGGYLASGAKSIPPGLPSKWCTLSAWTCTCAQRERAWDVVLRGGVSVCRNIRKHRKLLTM